MVLNYCIKVACIGALICTTSAYSHTNQSLEQAVTNHMYECDNGNAKECSKLGAMYDNGFGVKPDEEQSLFYYDKACQGGVATDCYNLGNTFYEGTKATAKDLVKAKRYYMKGCLDGSLESCRNLGFMLELGEGGEQDIQGAIKLYKIACDKGLEDSCTHFQRASSKLK